MKSIVELEECLQDSPNFRSAIEENEEDIEQLEVKLVKLVQLCNNMAESGKAYLNSKTRFVNGIWELVNYFKRDTVVANPLGKLISVLTEISRYQSILVDEAQQSTVKNLSDFIKNDIQHIKDCKRTFEKTSDEYDNALFRHSQVPKTRPHEIEEVGNLLKTIRSCFQHAALDYTAQISILQAKKRFEALDTLLSMLHMYTTYFHQGWDLIQDYEPFLKEVTATLTKLKDETTSLEKEMERRYSLVTQKDVIPVLVRNPLSKNVIRMEGFLFKRTSNAFKTWNRRWFIIQNRQLVYRKRSKDDLITIMEEDLRLCCVKLATEIDRRFCFEVQSPSKSHMLQADSEEACQQWVTALQAGISEALNNTLLENNRNELESLKSQVIQRLPVQKVMSNGQAPPAKPPRVYNRILSIPGNDLCCDCRSPEPSWASINLGITLCIECSGIHRSLGVHISKVKSITLDVWEPELLKVMAELGNAFVNSIYEAHVNENIGKRATPDCLRNVRETWIRAKYVEKAFVQSFPFLVPASNEEKLERGMPRRWSVRKLNKRRRSLKLRSGNKAQNPPFSEAVDFHDKKGNLSDDTHGHVKSLRSSEESTLQFKELIPNQEKHLCDIDEKTENTFNSDELPSAIDKESSIESNKKESNPNSDKQSSSSFKIEANSEKHSNIEIGKEDHRTKTKDQSNTERNEEQSKVNNAEQLNTEGDEEETTASTEEQSRTEEDVEESKASNEEQSRTAGDEEETKVSNEEQTRTEGDGEETKASNEEQLRIEGDEEETKASNEEQSSTEVNEINEKAKNKKELDIMNEIKEGITISEEQSNVNKIQQKEGQTSINLDKKEENNQSEEQSVFKCDNKKSKFNSEERSVINDEKEKEKKRMKSWKQLGIEKEQKAVKSSTGEIIGSEKYEFEDNPSLIGVEKEFSSKDKDIYVFGATIEQDIPGSTGIEIDSADETPSPNDDDDTTQEDDMSKLNPNLLLYRAAAAHNIPIMCQAQAFGGDLNWNNVEDRGRIPLHQAIMSGSIMACEYLLLNGAKVNNQDENGKTALHLATELGHTGQVCQLLKRGADQHIFDSAGHNALDIAVANANADIVTLLRLAKLNEEVQKDECGNSGDETFNEVVRDFSHMASHNPEKLCRQSNLAE